MSIARDGSTGSVPSLLRTSAVQSGMLRICAKAAFAVFALRMTNARHAVQRGEERAPASTLRVEHGLPLGGNPVEAAPPRAGFLDPAALDQSAPLQPVERRVQRRDVELQRAVRSLIDQLGDLVA